MTEMNDRMTKLEHVCNDTASQSPNFAPSYADIVRTKSPTTKVIQSSQPDGRLEKFEYISNKEERMSKLLQVEVNHPAILNSSPDLEAHVKQFYIKQLYMTGRKIDDGLHDAKLPQPNMTQVKLSDHSFKIFLRIYPMLRLSLCISCP